MQAKTKANGGFTLIETLVAMTLFAIGVLALAQVQLAGARSNTSAKTTSTASFLASDRLEELVHAPTFAEITEDNYPDEAYGEVSANDPRYAHFERATTVDDSTDVLGRVAMKTVTVTVTWKALRGDRHVSLTSRVARF